MPPPNWDNGIFSRYLGEISSLALVVLSLELEIQYCNQGFMNLLNLPEKPLGEKITDFFIENQQFPVLPEIGQSLSVRLPFQPKKAGLHLLLCQIFNTGRYYLVIGERTLHLESTIVEQISRLNQELANLTRDLHQKNRALTEMMEVQRRSENEKAKLIERLQEALQQVKTLSGLLPICSSCKKIRKDNGYWQQIEAYIREHSEAEFTHSICPDCIEKLYGDFFKKK